MCLCVCVCPRVTRLLRCSPVHSTVLHHHHHHRRCHHLDLISSFSFVRSSQRGAVVGSVLCVFGGLTRCFPACSLFVSSCALDATSLHARGGVARALPSVLLAPLPFPTSVLCSVFFFFPQPPLSSIEPSSPRLPLLVLRYPVVASSHHRHHGARFCSLPRPLPITFSAT